MILVTGGLGFIGSNIVRKLNEMGIENIVIVDNNIRHQKLRNVENLKYQHIIGLDVIHMIDEYDIDFVIHIGARTDTHSNNRAEMMTLNYHSSKMILEYCAKNNIPFIYASSGATYGTGSRGFDDRSNPNVLKPLNVYAESKNKFDKYILNEKTKKPDNWVGFKFFNVYGYGESHKGNMASVIFHGYNQIKETGKIKLFKSDNVQYKDGFQERDFIYVEDVADCIYWFTQNMDNLENGIYNLGTGTARTFLSLADGLINAMGKGEIEWVNMSKTLKGKYQYHTKANISKLLNAGYDKPFTSLEKGIEKYVEKLNA